MNTYQVLLDLLEFLAILMFVDLCHRMHNLKQ